MTKPMTQRGTVAIVSATNGLVVGIPAEFGGAVLPRLASRENAPVVSAARTQQVTSGAVSPQDMTEVVTGRDMQDIDLAADIAAKINPDAVSASAIGNDRSEFHEAKKVSAKPAKTRAQRAATAAEQADAGDDLTGE